MPIITMPDGANVQFPDEMPKEQIRSMIASKFPDIAQASQPSSWTSTMRERGADIADVVNRYQTGQQTLPETIFQGGMKGAFGTMSDVVGEALKPIVSAVTPDVIKEDFALAAKQATQMKSFNDLMGHWDSLSDRQKANIESLGLVPVGALARAGVKAGAPIIKEAIKDSIKVLPKEVGALKPLIEAKGNTLFNKTPNQLNIGIKANQAISKEYDLAKAKVSAAETSLRAQPLNVEAEEFIPQIQKSIGSLSKKVAPGSNDSQAIKTLSGIMDKIGGKEAPSTETFGVPSNPRTISSNDALEIRKGINDITSSPTFPSSGKATLLKIKKLADNVLDKAGETDPNFKIKWLNYKTHSQDVAKRFTNNDSIKDFWQPEDHIAWKAAQNNPELNPVSDATLSRANKMLMKLNTNDIGKIEAIINALPPQEASDIMRQAYILAKKEKVSIPNAIRLLATGHLPSGLSNLGKSVITAGGKTQPIEKAIKNIKKMKKPE